MKLTLTYQYRIKDSNQSLRKNLMVLSGKVNFIWNYCNNLQQESLNKFNSGMNTSQKWLSGFDLSNFTSGISKSLKIPAQTVQSICAEYAQKRIQFKKPYLKFRTNRKNRNLPWIPFKAQDLKHDDKNKGTFSFGGLKLKTWYSREIPGNAKITNGSIVMNNLGQWFVNVTFKQELTEEEVLNLTSAGQNITGIDVGLNPMMTLSIEEPDGNVIYKEINPNKYYRKLEEKLGKAQRARRLKNVRKISKKIANQRKDFNSKLANELIKNNHTIVMGIVDLKRLVRSNLKGHAKSWHDIGMYQLKVMLKSKAQKHSMKYEEVSEKELKSTQTCSCCGEITGPKGLDGLGVSSWTCKSPSCGVYHYRNRNSADNHRLAYKRIKQASKGSPEKKLIKI